MMSHAKQITPPMAGVSQRSGRVVALRQRDSADCGPTCLQIVSRYYGRHLPLGLLRERCFIDRQGISLYGMSRAAESIGFRTMGVRLHFEDLCSEITLPAIAHWHQRHFVVIHGVDRKHVHIVDPAHGKISYTHEEFLRGWADTNNRGILLVLEPTPDFFRDEDERSSDSRSSLGFLFSYLRPHRRLLLQLILGMTVASVITLILPFLTQALVDVGIQFRNISFVFLILVAQIMLFVGSTTVDLIKSWILLHVGSLVNISIISDFLAKLLRLPMRFFDSKMIGDILQRIEDHHRIETLLTSWSLNVLFSVLNLLVLSFVLLSYSPAIFGVFAAGSSLAVLWVIVFLRRRRIIDCKYFEHSSSNRGHLIQMIRGIQEIKLAGAETQLKWEWEQIQARMFKTRMRSLGVTQAQLTGNSFFNQLTSILVSFLAARAVISGDMTLGMMLATTFIVGQMTGPVQQLISFIHSAQDAKLSLDRLREIHLDPEEGQKDATMIREIGGYRSISVRGLSFSYSGLERRRVLEDVTLYVPEGAVTAVVGASGSGKTTLLKVLLKFYDHYEGEIRVGGRSLREIDTGVWRRDCGVVMQDGFIFSESIARNIALGEEDVNPERMLQAAEIANLDEFVQGLPLGYMTRIGDEGLNLSQGQKQRVLLARAVYKNPRYLFLDEATSSLDATNEREIMDRLRDFFCGRTVLIVAHRLSTVRDADQIVVLHRGTIVECGTHLALVEGRGSYYRLVKNQLELGM